MVQTQGIRILAVDDDRSMLEFISGQLGSRGFYVETALSGGEAVAIAGRGHFDLVICDLNMPLMDGIACMETLNRTNPSVQFIMISGEATVDKAVSAMKKGAYDFLQKPLHMESLLCLIEKALFKNQMDTVTELYEKSRDILSQMDIKELMELAVRKALLYFNAEQGCWMSLEDAELRIDHSCGMDDEHSKRTALELGQEALRDPAHGSIASDTLLRVTLIQNESPAAIFLLKRAPGSTPFSPFELREASDFAKRLLDITGASRLQRSLDQRLEELGRTYGELEKTKSLLVQKEKLAKLGELVAYMAHEINNPLASMIGYAEMLLDEAKDPSSKEQLSIILNEADR